ncbi:MAG: hypothetical protein E6826_06850 [Anaerococcus vaginalis]|nr:hypothetical protein [Anaerococcus vaginalis]
MNRAKQRDWVFKLIFENQIKNIDDIVNLIQSEQNVLEFLSENKNMWNVQNGKIQFDDDILLNQYNQLLLAVQ